MKIAFKKALSVLFAIITMAFLAALVSVSVFAAECPDGKHTMGYSVVNGDLHHSCKKCGANDAVAEKNADGGPVIYLGFNKADGTVRDVGNGFTPTGAIRLEDELINILSVYKSKDAKPVTVVLVGQFIAELDFYIDAGTRVTFTSVWGGKDYRGVVEGTDCGNARILLKTGMHCFNEIVFDKVVFEHVSQAKCIGLNGNNLTVTDVKYFSNGEYVEELAGTATYLILTGDCLDFTYEGTDLTNLNQTLNIDSGMWLGIEAGCYRTAASSAFLDMSGKITINISGNTQVLSRAKSAPFKYRGLTAVSQIVSEKGLEVVYNISGGKFVLNGGLNVVGRDSQAPDGIRNIAATYNISGGDFGGCAVYATVRDELTNSAPTIGQVAFNFAKGLNFGEIVIDESKDILGGIGGPAATVAGEVVVEPPVTEEPVTTTEKEEPEPVVTDTTTSTATTEKEEPEPVVTEEPATTTEKEEPKPVVTKATTPAVTTDASVTTPDGGVNVVLILCVVLAVAAVAAVVVVLIKKKK